MWNPFKRSLENPAIPLNEAYDMLVNSPSASGVSVTESSVLGNPAVWQGINLISNKVAKIPLELFRRGQDDGRERATSNPVYRLMKKRTSQTVSAFNFKQTMQAHALLHGNGYALITRNEFGIPFEMSILDPASTQCKQSGNQFFYETRINNHNVRFSYSDILHIKGLSSDAHTGYSLLHIMRDAFGLGLSLQRYGATFFKNNAKPDQVVILPPNVKTQEQADAYQKAWKKQHQGVSNSHSTAFVMNGTSVEQVPVNNDEGQWLQSREHDLIMVADILGIPASYVGAQSNVSYSSLEMDQQNLLQCLDPWLIQWELECENKLLTERQKERDTHFFEFNRKQLIQIDSKTEIELAISQYNNGLISWVELRKIMNKDTVKNLDDGWRIPSNIMYETPEPPPEPPAPAPVVEPVVDPALQPVEPPVDPALQPDNKRFRDMTHKTIERLVTRCKKAAEKGKLDMMSHKDIWSDSLEMFEKNDWIETKLQSIENELQEVLPEQISSVFDRLDIEKLTDEVMQ
tara:strand:+ start:259 stop:1809 length:1551 start_codon:yes stop_codon:yes gene_type:complete